MASVYTNDLRLEEIGSGEQSGTWGDTTNTNLELIAEGLSFGTEAITTNANTHTSTVADGASDPARSMYIKYTGALDSDCTITIAPNTLSRVHIIENATTDSGSSGPYNILISQGDGDAKVTIPSGHKKVVYLDGAGSGGVVVDAFTDLNVPSLFVKNPGTGDNSTALLTLQTAEADIAVNDVLGKISFQAPDEGTGTDAILVAAAIQAISEGDFSSSSNATSLAFMTGASEAATTKFVIASDGSLSTPTLGTSNVRFGVNAGNSIASGGNYNVVLGDEAGTALTTGDKNVAIGFDALKTTETSIGNTVVGYQSGAAITTGVQNTLIGALAGDNLTDADYNVAIGDQALSTDTLGSRSIAIGQAALATQNFTTATDGYNVAVGFGAGLAVTTGTRNTFIGSLSGDTATIAPNNVAVGYESLGGNVGAGGNVALGYQSLLVHTVSNADTFNTAVGFRSGHGLTSGTLNSLVGANTGDALTIGGFNTAIGQDALGGDTVGNFSTAIGIAALVVQNVGGSTATAMENVAVGRACGATLTTGKQNTFLGNNAGNSGVTAGNFTTGDGNVFVGYKASATAVDADYANVIGFTVAGAAGYTTLGKEGDDIRAAHGNVTWATVSDERYKKDIADATAGLSFINDLKPRTFKYKNKGDLPKAFSSYEEDSTEVYKNAKTNHGFIAQEVKVAMDAHSEIKDGFTLWDDRDDGSQEVAEAALIPILVKALQELSAANTALIARVKTLEDG